MWILVIEDEPRLAQLIKRGLEEGGFTVALAKDGIQGEELARTNSYDALVVDWRLPGRDGKTVIENLRASGHATPALMLTALDDVEHRVAGLDAGADDYLSKPFSFEELLARLRAITRRPPLIEQSQILKLGSVEIDLERHSVQIAGEPLFLRPKEFGMLELFLRKPGDVISRSLLAERVWGSALYVTDNVIDVTVSGLRQKIQSGFGQQPPDVEIVTTRGVGYSLREI